MQEKDCSIIEGGINFAVFRYPKKKACATFRWSSIAFL